MVDHDSRRICNDQSCSNNKRVDQQDLTELDLLESDAALTTKSRKKVSKNSTPKPMPIVTWFDSLSALDATQPS